MKTFVKRVILLLSLSITALSLAACTQSPPPDNPQDAELSGNQTVETPAESPDEQDSTAYTEDGEAIGPHGGGSVVTDFKPGEVELHQVILPWEAEEGEELENPYYVRKVNDEGEYVYAVLKASDHQVAYLPVGSTVIYTSEEDNCYYEKATNTYLLDGIPTEDEQYQLHVSINAPAPDAGSIPQAEEQSQDEPKPSDGEEIAAYTENTKTVSETVF